MGLVNLTVARLTLKLVYASRRWGTVLPNLGTLILWVLELFAMYATDGRTDRRTDKSNAYCPFLRAGYNNDDDDDDDDDDNNKCDAFMGATSKLPPLA